MGKRHDAHFPKPDVNVPYLNLGIRRDSVCVLFGNGEWGTTVNRVSAGKWKRETMGFGLALLLFLDTCPFLHPQNSWQFESRWRESTPSVPSPATAACPLLTSQSQKILAPHLQTLSPVTPTIIPGNFNIHVLPYCLLQIFVNFLNILICLLCLDGSMHGTRVAIKGQPVRVGLFPSPHGCQGLNFGHQAWLQVPLTTEPSRWQSTLNWQPHLLHSRGWL